MFDFTVCLFPFSWCYFVLCCVLQGFFCGFFVIYPSFFLQFPGVFQNYFPLPMHHPHPPAELKPGPHPTPPPPNHRPPPARTTRANPAHGNTRTPRPSWAASSAGNGLWIEKSPPAASGPFSSGATCPRRSRVAVKAERRDSTFPQLHREKKFYQMLANGGDGIPQIRFYGNCSTGHRYRILIMDLLGPIWRIYCSVRRVVQPEDHVYAGVAVADEDGVHPSRGILYRDIKSENFLVGRKRTANYGTLFVVDFGLSKEFINPVSQQHIPFNVKKGSVGTPRCVLFILRKKSLLFKKSMKSTHKAKSLNWNGPWVETMASRMGQNAHSKITRKKHLLPPTRHGNAPFTTRRLCFVLDLNGKKWILKLNHSNIKVKRILNDFSHDFSNDFLIFWLIFSNYWSQFFKWRILIVS